MLSFVAAVFYNISYLTVLFGWLSETFMLPLAEDEPFKNIGLLDVVFNMMMVYQSVLQAPIYVLNAGIIVKEEWMIMFQ